MEVRVSSAAQRFPPTPVSAALNRRVLWFERPTLVKRFEARARTER
jgi:hypothetical protein